MKKFLALILLLSITSAAHAQSANGNITFRGTLYKTNDTCRGTGPGSIPVDQRLSWANYAYHVLRDRWAGVTVDGLPTGNGVHLQGTFPFNNGVRLTLGYTFTRLNERRKTANLRQIFVFEGPGGTCGYTYNGAIRGR